MPALRRILSILVFFPIFFSTHIAQAQAPTPSPTPTSIRNDGEQIRWSFTDGREAGLFAQKLPPTVFAIDFTSSDTTCPRAVERAPKCQLKLPLVITRFAVKWNRNADEAKLGQTLKVRFGESQTFELANSHLGTVYHHKLDPREFAMDPLRIECDDYTWLGGGELPPEQVTFVTWANELMLPNPETDVNENTSIGSVSDARFVRDGRGLKLVTTGEWTAIFPGLLSTVMYIGDSIHLVERSGEGQTCQSSIKPNTAAVVSELNDYIAKQGDHYTPYLLGADGRLRYAEQEDEFFISLMKSREGMLE